MSEVEEETTEVEAIEGDDADIEEAQEEEEQTPAEAAAAEGSHELADKLKAATKGYHTRIANLLGREMEDNICPTCDGFGFATAEQVQASTTGLPEDFVHPDEYVQCRSCNGYGEILSGSKNPGHAVVTCTKCSGLGYTIQAAHTNTTSATVYDFAPQPQTMNGTYVPGRGFIPYGETEPIPGSGPA